MNTPIQWCPERIEQALEVASMGRPMAEQAKAYGQSARTLWEHLAKNTTFKDAWNRARECSYFLVADTIPHVHEEFPEMSAHQWQVIANTRMWWLSKMYPAIFGDKIQVQVEHVDLKGALSEARTRVITLTSNAAKDSFSLDQSPEKP